MGISVYVIYVVACLLACGAAVFTGIVLISHGGIVSHPDAHSPPPRVFISTAGFIVSAFLCQIDPPGKCPPVEALGG